jgi:preprotein translocase subunit SecA
VIKIVDKLLHAGEGRRLKTLEEQVRSVGALEPEMEALSDEELAGLTPLFRERVDNGEPLEDLMDEAFAAAREAARRSVEMRPFDVQIMGAVVLFEGDIAEMKTGEGKTLVATMPMYLRALAGRGVHLVTVNDYLARSATPSGWAASTGPWASRSASSRR